MSDLRKVKLRGFTYTKQVHNPRFPQNKRFVRAVANRGDEVDYDSLNEVDQERADKFDVFYTPEEIAAAEARAAGNTTAAESSEDIVLDENSSVEELATWIKDDEPTVNELLEFVDDDVELAKKVLEAENQVTGNDPRSTLKAGLEKLISQA